MKYTQFEATDGKFRIIDFEDRFENKRQATQDIVDEGGDITRDMVEDLVLTAYKAIRQE